MTMLDRAKEIQDRVVALRRDIHRHPELGFKEFRTAELVANTLGELGIRVETGVGKTGVVGYLGEGSPVVALRADMDALPVNEINEVPYASCEPGVMHACGHDAHTAILMGVAMLLHDMELPGQVRFLFQPSEETADDEGKSGAARMIEDGVMEGVDVVMALHMGSDLPCGQVQLSAGPSSAAVDSFYAAIEGQGCHGAHPDDGLDPVFLASQVIDSLYGIISRRINPFSPAVISVGSIHAGVATNVIPQSLEMSGTIRSRSPEVRQKLHKEIERAFSVAEALGGRVDLEIRKGLPSGRNDESVVANMHEVIKDLIGEEMLAPTTSSMGAEDFAYMTELAPGAMFRLGGQIGDEIRRGHSETYDIDEDSLPVGMAILAESARRYLTGEFSIE